MHERRSLFLHVLFAAFRFFSERFGMDLAGEILDSCNDAGRGTIHGVTNNRVAAIANGTDDLPRGKSGERFDVMRSGFRMRGGENQKIRLKPGYFFEVDLGPVLRGIDDGDGSRMAEGIGDESVFADGDKRLGPDGEEHALRRKGADALLQIREPVLHLAGDGRACFRCAEDIGKIF